MIARIVDGSRFSRVQAALRRDAGLRLGAPARLPDRHPREQRHPVLGVGAEGRAVHRAVQPDRHAARVPAEHHRLHGRQEVRAGGHHQARREAHQRGVELDGARDHDHDRRELRRRQLRDVRPRLRPALPVHLAEPPHRGDGRQAARRRARHHPARQAAEARRAVRRARSRAAAGDDEDQIDKESYAYFATARLWDDGIIDPRDTRTVLAIALSAAHSAPVQGTTS